MFEEARSTTGQSMTERMLEAGGGGVGGPGVIQAAKAPLLYYTMTVDDSGYVCGLSSHQIDAEASPALVKGDVLISQTMYNDLSARLDSFERIRYVHGDIVCEGQASDSFVKERIDRWVESRLNGKIGIRFSLRFDTFWFDHSNIAALSLSVSLDYPFHIEDEKGVLAIFSGDETTSVSCMVLDYRNKLVDWLHAVRRNASSSSTLTELESRLKSADVELEKQPWYKA